jgi:hypothetical protein
VEVDKYIVASFARHEEDKLWDKCVIYVDNQGRYSCPFHPGRPRDGHRSSLVDHVKSYANFKGPAYGTAAYDELALEHFYPHPICKLSCLIVVVADGRQSSLVITFYWRCFFLRLL